MQLPADGETCRSLEAPKARQGTTTGELWFPGLRGERDIWLANTATAAHPCRGVSALWVEQNSKVHESSVSEQPVSPIYSASHVTSRALTTLLCLNAGVLTSSH